MMLRGMFDPMLDGWRRCTVATAATVVDTGSHLDVTFTDTAEGYISATVDGSWVTTDPLDGPHLMWLALDADGNACDPAKDWGCDVLIIERTAPALDSATSVVGGLVNEAANSATIDGPWGGLRYASAGRNVRAGNFSNGTAANITDDGASGGTLRQAKMLTTRGHNTGSVAHTQGLDASGVPIAADYASTGGGGGPAGWASAGVPTIFFAITRTDVTKADAAAVVHEVWYRITAQDAVKT